VQREVREETHLHVEVGQHLLDNPDMLGGTYQRLHTYLCHVIDGEAQPGYEPEEEAAEDYAITAVRWLDLRQPTAWGMDVQSDPITYPLRISLIRCHHSLPYCCRNCTPAQIPHQQGVVASCAPQVDVGTGLLPQRVGNQAGAPAWRAQQIAQALGAGGCLLTPEQVGAKLAEKQAMGAVAPLHDRDQGGQERRDEPTVKLLIERAQERSEEGYQVTR
jgi:hypothetical protein